MTYEINDALPKAMAVDFDGCICKSRWPEIGAPNAGVIAAIKQRQREGWKVILWTCRSGELLTQALDWCRVQGLTFDAVNENLPERIKLYGGDCRKVSADEYWDDKAVEMSSDKLLSIRTARNKTQKYTRDGRAVVPTPKGAPRV